MRIAISNIAWEQAQDPDVSERMNELGVEGVEIAPTKVWPHPLEVSDHDVAAYRISWESRGLPIVALQALLFGRNDLVIFGTAERRKETGEYLAGIMRLASRLGAHALVFGSPVNRARGEMSLEQALNVAIPFFRELGERAMDLNVVLCIEANPPQYKCDFVTTSEEAQDLVSAVGSAGFGLHLDTAAMHLAGEDVPAQVRKLGARACHFHVSAPNLGPVGPDVPIDYPGVAAALRGAPYLNWVSIEMRPPSDGLAGISRALQYVAGVFR
ncbi:MAG: sugar phosphate isomerase/epimerase [Acidobacteria bacterium]|nr:sugar phosphate isomerase/epimerase [Acidobacteriota bacterium]